jgi:hypothetical protein
MLKYVIAYQEFRSTSDIFLNDNQYPRRTYMGRVLFLEQFEPMFCRLSPHDIAFPLAVAAHGDDIPAAELILGWSDIPESNLTVDVFNVAAEHGRAKFLEWALSHGLDVSFASHDSPGACKAAEFGHVNILRMLRYDYKPLWARVSRVAARHGQLEVLKYMVSEGYRIAKAILPEAIAGGNIELIDYIVELMKSPAFSHIELRVDALFLRASSSGRVPVLNKLVELGYTIPTWYRDCLWFAASNGRIDAMQWLLDHGFPWHPTTARACITALDPHGALVADRMIVFRWAIDHGCPFHSDALAAIASRDLKLATSLLDRVETPIDAMLFYRSIEKVSDVKIWAWGIEHGIIPPRRFFQETLVSHSHRMAEVHLLLASYWEFHDALEAALH